MSWWRDVTAPTAVPVGERASGFVEVIQLWVAGGGWRHPRPGEQLGDDEGWSLPVRSRSSVRLGGPGKLGDRDRVCG